MGLQILSTRSLNFSQPRLTRDMVSKLIADNELSYYAVIARDRPNCARCAAFNFLVAYGQES
jgi:hypothetical protein